MLFFVGIIVVFYLIENGNGEVCVVDCVGLLVVGVDFFGELWFWYKGNVIIFFKYIKFKFFKIINDS